MTRSLAPGEYFRWGRGGYIHKQGPHSTDFALVLPRAIESELHEEQKIQHPQLGYLRGSCLAGVSDVAARMNDQAVQAGMSFCAGQLYYRSRHAGADGGEEGITGRAC